MPPKKKIVKKVVEPEVEPKIETSEPVLPEAATKNAPEVPKSDAIAGGATMPATGRYEVYEAEKGWRVYAPTGLPASPVMDEPRAREMMTKFNAYNRR